jgi:general secretion pathway protein K
MRQRTFSAEDRQRGFVLVTALWLIAALAALAAIYLAYAKASASASALPGERLQAEAAIRAGLELAAYRAIAAPDPAQKRRGRFQTRLGGALITVEYRAESARVDLNAAPREMLSGLLVALGVAADKAQEHAARILDWRGSADKQTALQDVADYQSAGLRYGPRQGPFGSPLELSLVLGLPEPLVAQLQRYVTVYNGQAKVDVLDADPTVLAALPQMTPELLAPLLKLRADPSVDTASLTQALGPAAKFATLGPSKATRAEIVADIGPGRKFSAEVVFSLNEKSDEPFEILDWRDDFDGAPRPW